MDKMNAFKNEQFGQFLNGGSLSLKMELVSRKIDYIYELKNVLDGIKRNLDFLLLKDYKN